MKTILLSFILLSQGINRGYRQLTWGDFRGSKPKGDVLVAAEIITELDFGTSSEWKPEWNLPIDQDTVTGYNAFVRFDPERSYTTTLDPYILKHEQGHFDLVEIIARRINKSSTTHMRLSIDEWHTIQNSYWVEFHDLEDQYDRETNHSQNRESQERWNQWIAEQLSPKK